MSTRDNVQIETVSKLQQRADWSLVGSQCRGGLGGGGGREGRWGESGVKIESVFKRSGPNSKSIVTLTRPEL